MTGLKVGGDVEQALENIGVPSYVLDKTGIIRWVNAAVEQLVGDVRGRHFTTVVAPEDGRRARELFAQRVLGTSPATEATAHLVSTAGTRVAVEISAVPLRTGERVVGVFGLIEGRPDDSSATPPPHLTPAPSRGASAAGAGLLDEANCRRAPPKPRNGQEPRPPTPSSARRQHPTRGGRRRPGRITVLVVGAAPATAPPFVGRCGERYDRLTPH